MLRSLNLRTGPVLCDQSVGVRPFVMDLDVGCCFRDNSRTASQSYRLVCACVLSYAFAFVERASHVGFARACAAFSSCVGSVDGMTLPTPSVCSVMCALGLQLITVCVLAIIDHRYPHVSIVSAAPVLRT